MDCFIRTDVIILKKKFEYYVRYVGNLIFWLDIKNIFVTSIKVIKGAFNNHLG